MAIAKILFSQCRLAAVVLLVLWGSGCEKKADTAAPTPTTTAPTSNAPTLLSLQPSQTAAPAPVAGPRVILYNGLALNSPWPPHYAPPGTEAMPVPYLRESPAVVPIDVGRQLFVDDFLIESTTNIKRTFHLAEYCVENPILKPEKPWETAGGRPTAMVNDGGVWYDIQDKLFKMWYTAGEGKTCFAYSTNGTNWEKPLLDVVKDSNIVFDKAHRGQTVWHDIFATNPLARFKAFRLDDARRFEIFDSGDGIHWGQPVGTTTVCGDGANIFYNPVRRVWVFNTPAETSMGKARKYYETRDIHAGINWNTNDALWWVGADKFDTLGNEPRSNLVSLSVVPYESLLVGMFTLSDGQPAAKAKPNRIEMGFSRDGFHWVRPDRRAFIPMAQKPEDWNWSDLRASSSSFLLAGRKLQFYVSGRSANGTGSTGLATLRRDGFASMDAEETEGVLTTWPVMFKGKYLFLNVDNLNGEMRIEALDQSGQVIEPFNRTNSAPITIDSTLVLAGWNEIKGNDISVLNGKAVKFRIFLKKSRLYSFWISSTLGGASGGFLAGGGPHFTLPIDSIGNGSYKGFPAVTNFPGGPKGP